MTGPAFVTNDLYIAAFLEAVGYPVQRISGPRSRRTFEFVGVKDEDLSAYHRGTRPISVPDVFRCYRQLKARAFTEPV